MAAGSLDVPALLKTKEVSMLFLIIFLSQSLNWKENDLIDKESTSNNSNPADKGACHLLYIQTALSSLIIWTWITAIESKPLLIADTGSGQTLRRYLKITSI